MRKVTAEVEKPAGTGAPHGARIHAGKPASYSEQRSLEIGMTLAFDPRLIILDEPMAGMSQEETDYTVGLIREITQNRTLMIVEHDMYVVFTLADRISVLVYGEIIATGTPKEIRENARVREAYLGEEAHSMLLKTFSMFANCTRIDGKSHILQGVTFDLKEGARRSGLLGRTWFGPFHHHEGDHGAGAADKRRSASEREKSGGRKRSFKISPRRHWFRTGRA